MITRKLVPKLLQLASFYPVVVVTGPRQAGKTTLCRAAFPAKAYVSLESLDNREFASTDPRGFLAAYRDGAIFDEIQQVPDLVSYLQSEVDEQPTPGRFILTGSQHLGISQTVSQSLAGRCGLLTLLAPDWQDIRRCQASKLLSFSVNMSFLACSADSATAPRRADRRLPKCEEASQAGGQQPEGGRDGYCGRRRRCGGQCE